MAKVKAGRERVPAKRLAGRTESRRAVEPRRGAAIATRQQAKATLLAAEREAAERTIQTAKEARKEPLNATQRIAAKRIAEQAKRVVIIRELDPYAKCGPDTSVRELYRVDEAVNGAKHVHLVFFDRHGWYCLHGRYCPAVNDVRRHDRAHAVRTHETRIIR